MLSLKLSYVAYIFVRLFFRVLLGKERRNRYMYKHFPWLASQGDFVQKFMFKSPSLRRHAYEARFQEMLRWLRTLSYESAVSKEIIKMNGDIFVDVGANTGYYSILLHKNFRRVYAFEPIQTTAKVLFDYLKRLGVQNVIPIVKAVSNVNGIDTFVLYNYNPYVCDPVISPQLGKGENAKVEMSSVTLASYFPTENLDLVKVDVEGNEWKVLHGAEPIMQNIKSWMIELHDGHRRQELEHLLGSYGYSTRWLDEHHILAERSS